MWCHHASLPGALFGIFNPVAQISTAGAEFMPPGAQYRSQRRNTGAPKGLNFLTMLAGSRPQGLDLPSNGLQHSGILLTFSIFFFFNLEIDYNLEMVLHTKWFLSFTHANRNHFNSHEKLNRTFHFIHCD